MLHSRPDHAAPRILIAGRDDVIDAVAQAQANGERYETATADDGIAVMRALFSISFDLAIIDIAKPRLEGLRLIALIRATPCLRHVPVLAIASPNEPASTLEGGRAGADDYLPRPFEWPLLAMRIRQLTGRT